MTLSEFKAWFEGYTEGLEGAPTKAQFDRIKAKVGEITGAPVTYPIYVDRWVQPYRPYWDRYWATLGGTTGGATWSSAAPDAGNISYGTSNAVLQLSAGGEPSFDSHAAMYELGKMEATH